MTGKLVELDRLYNADGEVLHLYGLEQIDESRLELLEAEVARLRATVEALDERLSQIERQREPAPDRFVPSLTARLPPSSSASTASTIRRRAASGSTRPPMRLQSGRR